jgi:hypothetical protein
MASEQRGDAAGAHQENQADEDGDEYRNGQRRRDAEDARDRPEEAVHGEPPNKGQPQRERDGNGEPEAEPAPC